MHVHLSLGANTGNRQETIQRAISLLTERIGACLFCSHFIETDPVGFASANRFLNAAAGFEVNSALRHAGHEESLPEALLSITESIERELGRTEKSTDGAYADRPIDIDILFLDDLVIDTGRLQIPHPRLHERRFVLEPLAEIAPTLKHPVLGMNVSELLARLNRAHIERLGEATPEAADAISRLLAQLTTTPPPFDQPRLAALVGTPLTHLFILRDEEQIIRGMATLCITAAPTGTKAWIEDVVVDAACRGRGYGRQLVDHLTTAAFAMRADKVMLTSRPSRLAANALYRSAGFEQKETNVYVK